MFGSGVKRSLIVLAALLFACQQREVATSQPTPDASAAAPSSTMAAAPTMPPMAMPEHDALAQQAAIPRSAPILSASIITNPAARIAYEKAREIPGRLSKMYCYCHCHEHMGHVSLLTCFQTDHAEECQVCQQEAIQAWNDWKDGLPVNVSQRAADYAFNGGTPPPSMP